MGFRGDGVVFPEDGKGIAEDLPGLPEQYGFLLGRTVPGAQETAPF
jgi:hypothetical protein